MKVELKDIKEFIRIVAKSGIKKLDIKLDDLKLTIENQGAETPLMTSVSTNSDQLMFRPSELKSSDRTSQQPEDIGSEKEDESAKYKIIEAPLIGTFYRSMSPDKPPLTQEGSEVSQGNAVCIIEAMKIFNEIESDFSGKIVKVLVEDGTPVEYGQPLFWVDPR